MDMPERFESSAEVLAFLKEHASVLGSLMINVPSVLQMTGPDGTPVDAFATAGVLVGLKGAILIPMDRKILEEVLNSYQFRQMPLKIGLAPI